MIDADSDLPTWDAALAALHGVAHDAAVNPEWRTLAATWHEHICRLVTVEGICWALDDADPRVDLPIALEEMSRISGAAPLC